VPTRSHVATGRHSVDLLPSDEPLSLIDSDGRTTSCAELAMPPVEILQQLYRRMVIGRRFDTQVTTLTKQGRLAVYASSRGQEACQAGATLAMRDGDWLFPTYRDSVAIVNRSVDPLEVLSLLRGQWHCGYDPYAHQVAPQCTPLATNTLHAVGFGQAAAMMGEGTVAVVLLGDGATSEGDTHEALNFAAVWRAPVVFFIQNNGYAISVPLAKQTAAPTLAHKAVGYGMPGKLVDGNDAACVYAATLDAIDHAARGYGPTLIEAITYRIEAHTNADDSTRYRESGEVEVWLQRDPIDRLEKYLRSIGELDDTMAAAILDESEQFADDVRRRINVDSPPDPSDLFQFVYAEPTLSLLHQREELLRLLDDEEGPT
jgi:2-oxoisovalerate dehydrogenase E1 component alpha subunit